MPTWEDLHGPEKDEAYEKRRQEALDAREPWPWEWSKAREEAPCAEAPQ